MRPPTDARGRTRLAIAGVGATNALPILGVVVWDWSLATLILVYWLEIGIGLWWAAVKAGVAERPSEYPESMILLGTVRYRRGGLTIPGTALTVYIHNLAMVGLTVVFLGGLWAIVGGVILVSILNWDGVGIGLETAYSVLAVGACLFVTRGWETLSTYLRDEQYREVNAQQAIQDALWPLLILGVLVTMFVPPPPKPRLVACSRSSRYSRGSSHLTFCG
ncbi:hypothetical protein G6M89_21565 [Natronolimnobius sp. AArcel1]|uniref:DUF6498-containing protein n=1 Tax=Natronolimnobius sp. AArcel1 TaxID=1679093 RepID=UPI0013EAB15E|nr:DUF6498-containing protein [Natronolimnobius sp. AArcel1]NGM71538.1 hypothetical protein [Natronolimnobius sp. AArcel1]